MAETASTFTRIEVFRLPRNLLVKTVATLRAEGQGRVESLVFWAGAVGRGVADVRHLFVPAGPGVSKDESHLRVSDAVIAALCDLVDPPRVAVLGQVHTHRYEAFHSPTDDANSLDTPGYVSIVIPHFAEGGADLWEDWAFHECLGSGTFRLLPPAERARRFQIIAPSPIEICHVHA